MTQGEVSSGGVVYANHECRSHYVFSQDILAAEDPADVPELASSILGQLASELRRPDLTAEHWLINSISTFSQNTDLGSMRSSN